MKSKLNLQLLFDNNPDPMWVFEPKSLRILEVNETAVADFGYSRAQFLAMTIADLRAPEGLEKLVAAIGRIKPGATAAGVWRLRRKDSSFGYFDIRWHPVDYNGVAAVLASIRDVSRAVELEQERDDLLTREREFRLSAEASAEHFQALFDAARTNEERFRLIARATNDVIWDWDLVAGQVWWNENLQSIFGHDPALLETGPESWSNRVHPEDREWVLQSIHDVIDGSGENWVAEYRFLHDDGKPMTVIDRGFVIRNAAGRAVRMLGSMADVTRQRELDDRLRQSEKMEAIGQLTGGIAHDFNNLLTVILGNADTLSELLSGDKKLQTLATMTASAAERGAELTNRLLAFARRQALEPRHVDLDLVIAGMEGLVKRTLSENIEIELVRNNELWTTEVDPGQLEVALLNLAINARDAMPGGGKLTFETTNVTLDDTYAKNRADVTPGQYVVIAVSDTGSGMSADVVARAFEPFYTTKEKGKGSGLGLSMVYGFVKQSGGYAGIYSEVGEGTTVRLYFPRATGPGADARRDDPPAPLVGGSESILIVEDDPMVRGNLISQLETLGYRVTSAKAGQQALEIIRQTPDIDLLFTDIVMPGGMNGRELAEAAVLLRPDIKVLFTSGYTENAIVHNGRLDRGLHLLSKPYRRQEMAAMVRKVLDEVCARDG